MPDHIPDTGKMLARYAAAFAKVAERWPDAPGMPDGYKILDKEIYGPCMILGKREDHMAVPTFAAEAVVMRVVAELGKWWMQQDSLDRLWSIRPDRHADWLVWVTVFDQSPSVFANFDTDLAAHLAALRAIVEQGEASRG